MPKKKLPKAGSPKSYQNVLLEEMRSQIELTLEAVEEGKGENAVCFQELQSKVKMDLQLTQAALSKRIDGVHTELSQLINHVRTELGEKIEKISDRLDHHEEEITHLKEASA